MKSSGYSTSYASLPSFPTLSSVQFVALTIFPNIFDSFIKTSLIGKAIDSGLIDFKPINIREFTTDKHQRVDDYPYGGGPGMIMKPGPLVRATDFALSLPQKTESVSTSGTVAPQLKSKVINLSPRGVKLTQRVAQELTDYQRLIFVCGRYEGIDQRFIDSKVGMELSIGDYTIMGGEVASMVAIECIARLVPGVIGNSESLKCETHSTDINSRNNYIEYPQYTKPRDIDGLKVPKVLLSGNHKEINNWREQQSLKLRKERDE